MIYFIQDRQNLLVKIGYSNNVARRLKLLQTACSGELILLLSIPGDMRVERAIHENYDECRIRGEWFRLPEEEMKLIGDPRYRYCCCQDVFDPDGWDANIKQFKKEIIAGGWEWD